MDHIDESLSSTSSVAHRRQLPPAEEWNDNMFLHLVIERLKRNNAGSADHCLEIANRSHRRHCRQAMIFRLAPRPDSPSQLHSAQVPRAPPRTGEFDIAPSGGNLGDDQRMAEVGPSSTLSKYIGAPPPNAGKRNPPFRSCSDSCRRAFLGHAHIACEPGRNFFAISRPLYTFRFSAAKALSSPSSRARRRKPWRDRKCLAHARTFLEPKDRPRPTRACFRPYPGKTDQTLPARQLAVFSPPRASRRETR